METKREFIPTEYGYQVEHDCGAQGKAVDAVHIPPHDPEAAARTRRDVNAVLARYGYRLTDRGEEQPKSLTEPT